MTSTEIMLSSLAIHHWQQSTINSLQFHKGATVHLQGQPLGAVGCARCITCCHEPRCSCQETPWLSSGTRERDWHRRRPSGATPRPFNASLVMLGRHRLWPSRVTCLRMWALKKIYSRDKKSLWSARVCAGEGSGGIGSCVGSGMQEAAAQGKGRGGHIPREDGGDSFKH